METFQQRTVSYMTDTNISPELARELIATANEAEERGREISSRSWLAPVLSVFIGALMGAFLIASVYFLPDATAVEAAWISGAYVAGILLAVTAYNLGRKVVTRGWLDRYQKGIAASSAVFFVALALSFLVEERSLALWLPLAIAAALPVTILGAKQGAR